MLQLSRDQLVAVAVAVAIEKKWINIDAPRAITFFSEYDEWVFTAEFDNVVCDTCLGYENNTFTGDTLRSLFPELEIIDLETIRAFVHPNCRCRLDRITYYGDVGFG